MYNISHFDENIILINKINDFVENSSDRQKLKMLKLETIFSLSGVAHHWQIIIIILVLAVCPNV
jgi:hypothetical protein